MPLKFITPQLKDELLAHLLNSESVQKGEDYQTNYLKESRLYDCPPFMVKLVYEQFEELGLTHQDVYNGGALIRPTSHAYDVFAHGGFTAQEEILKANIEKLGRELDVLSKELSPKFLDTANRLAGIGSCILGALSLFKA